MLNFLFALLFGGDQGPGIDPDGRSILDPIG